MEKVVTIHQPDFLPYLGFFNRLKSSHHYVILDHVQLSASGWIHRDKIKTSKGTEWISIPIEKIRKKPMINEARIVRNKQFDQLIRKIEESYRNTKYFWELFPHIKKILKDDNDSLCEVNIKLIRMIADWLDIKFEYSMSSQYDVTAKRSKMNAILTKEAGGSVYLSGVGARDYHDEKPFVEEGIKVKWQDYHHPVYQQEFFDFVPYLSIIDPLFNIGIEQTTKLI